MSGLYAFARTMVELGGRRSRSGHFRPIFPGKGDASVMSITSSTAVHSLDEETQERPSKHCIQLERNGANDKTAEFAVTLSPIHHFAKKYCQPVRTGMSARRRRPATLILSASSQFLTRYEKSVTEPDPGSPLHSNAMDYSLPLPA